MAWTTPGTATAGEVLTAAFWNTNVRDNQNMQAIGCRAYRSSNLTYTNNSDIVWNAEGYDTGGMFTAGGSTITTVEPGIYVVHIQGLLQASTITHSQVELYKGSTSYAGGGWPGFSTIYCRFAQMHIVKAAANDTWKVRINMTATGTITLLGDTDGAVNSARFEMHWIAPAP